MLRHGLSRTQQPSLQVRNKTVELRWWYVKNGETTFHRMAARCSHQVTLSCAYHDGGNAVWCPRDTATMTSRSQYSTAPAWSTMLYLRLSGVEHRWQWGNILFRYTTYYNIFNKHKHRCPTGRTDHGDHYFLFSTPRTRRLSFTINDIVLSVVLLPCSC